MDSIFLSSCPDKSQACTLYRRGLHIHASKIFGQVDINIHLSIKICFSSFHFWKADTEIKLLRWIYLCIYDYVSEIFKDTNIF